MGISPVGSDDGLPASESSIFMSWPWGIFISGISMPGISIPGMSIPGMSMSCGCARGFDPRGEIGLRDDADDRSHFGMAGAPALRALNPRPRVGYLVAHVLRRAHDLFNLPRTHPPFAAPGRPH